MKFLASIGLMMAATSTFAAAGDFWLNIHTVSWHTGPGFYAYEGPYDRRSSTLTPYNNTNFGVDIEYESDDNLSFRGGLFDNSADNVSFFAGVNFHTSYTNGIGVGLNIGGATGYDEMTGMTLTPMVLPALFAVAGPVRMELNGLPPIGQYDGLVHLVFGVKF